ncbi:MAG TPA: hypothetical protein VEA18_03120 [Candidatus Kapabacteria bacterium]|nr:hypothetical protein [Candidatus Kapabacteria bacterium]
MPKFITINLLKRDTELDHERLPPDAPDQKFIDLLARWSDDYGFDDQVERELQQQLTAQLRPFRSVPATQER